jgi:hypothetical protein
MRFLLEWGSLHSGLHVNNAAEFVSIDTLLSGTSRDDHPLSDGRCPLYLGIGRPPGDPFQTSSIPDGFCAAFLQNEECEGASLAHRWLAL